MKNKFENYQVDIDSATFKVVAVSIGDAMIQAIRLYGSVMKYFEHSVGASIKIRAIKK